MAWVRAMGSITMRIRTLDCPSWTVLRRTRFDRRGWMQPLDNQRDHKAGSDGLVSGGVRS